MTTKRHVTHTKNLLSMINKRLISMRKQLEMIFKQTFTKAIVTKKEIPILTITIPFYKLMLIIMKVLQKAQRNTKITIKKKYHRTKKVKMHHRWKRKHLKRSPRKINTHH